MSAAAGSRREWTDVRPANLEGISVLSARFTTHSFERHSHDTFSLGITRAGVQAFGCRGSKHRSTNGHVITFNPDEPHDGYAGSDDGFEYTMLYVSREGLSRLADGGSGGFYFRSPLIHDEPGMRLFSRAIDALRQPGETLRAHAWMGAVVARLVARNGDGARTSGRARHAPSSLDRARDFLECHYAEDVRVEDLAALLQVSRVHATRSFTERFRTPPHVYLNAVRIRHAKRLLAAGVAPAEVAAEVGYADQSHLTRRFKGSVGLTPAAWATAMRAAR